MRPLRLELEGFTAFRRPTLLDFSELDLFAITGATGAGKSSLIDAICYAMYGRVPRVTTEVSACISQGLDRMQVTLEFQANGRVYRVLRETRRRGQGNVRLEVLNDGDWQPLADRARDVTQKMEEIVGLDFEAFIRCALLPQDQFQEFLAGSPDRRRDVLDKLLRIEIYKRMQARAGVQAQSLQSEIVAIERRLLEELADATPDNLARQRQELKQTEADSSALELAIKALQEGQVLAKELSSAAAELANRLAANEAADARLAAASQVIEGGDARLAQLRTELAATKQSLDRNPYDDERFAILTGAANLAAALERSTKGWKDAEVRIGALDRAATAAAAAAQTASRAHEEARGALEAAEATLEEARRHDLAATLQLGLEPGDPCPVCGGIIGELVPTSGADLAAARPAFDAARQTEASCRAVAAEKATKHAVALSELAQAREQGAQLHDLLAVATRELDEALPAAESRSLAAIQAALATQRTARDERSQLQKREAELARHLTDVERELTTARDAMSEAAAESRAADAAVEQTRARVDAARARLAEMAATQDWSDIADGLDTGFDPLPRLEGQLNEAMTRQAAVLTRRGGLDEKIRRLEQDIEAALALNKDLVAKKASYNVAADLALMLRADRFQAYVQAAALRSLAEDGSRRLLELSGGRYEFEVAAGGQDFVVKDKWNADDLRSVRTLSGGETFLASLALALALADGLPGLAPSRRLSLDSIFLDEGFGSLDPEALDRAADALDALRMEDRLVCVITHLKELAERMPAHVIVNKSAEGSTLTVA